MPEETVVAEEQPKPKKGFKLPSLKKPLLIIVLALLSSGSGAVTSWLLVKKTLSAGAPEQEGAENKKTEAEEMAELLEKGAVVTLEPFVVNLADTDAPRYLRIKINLLIDDKEKLPEILENQALQLKLRDVILESLAAKSSQQLINAEGKSHLRQEIKDKVAIYFHEPKLADVMFTEFVIQL